MGSRRTVMVTSGRFGNRGHRLLLFANLITDAIEHEAMIDHQSRLSLLAKGLFRHETRPALPTEPPTSRPHLGSDAPGARCASMFRKRSQAERDQLPITLNTRVSPAGTAWARSAVHREDYLPNGCNPSVSASQANRSATPKGALHDLSLGPLVHAHHAPRCLLDADHSGSGLRGVLWCRPAARLRPLPDCGRGRCDRGTQALLSSSPQGGGLFAAAQPAAIITASILLTPQENRLAGS